MSDFSSRFYAIHNFHPFRWQEELFEKFVKSDIPPLIDLPTGAGKTAVMTVWLLALAEQSRLGAIKLPRRLVWVVDRRVVVDQATVEAENLAKRLEENLALASVAQILGYSLAISTLRGEKEDNREWSQNPARPAIVVGTVDMIGSRLLFSGYGDGRYYRPQHAGLLGTDTLVVNDEAHLTPAFAELLKALRPHTRMQPILLSATQREHAESVFPASLDPDLADPDSPFARRYRAVKRLHIELVDKSYDAIEKRALIPDRRTIVFVRSPKDAQKLAATIAKEHKISVPLITGMQRGKERDELLKNEIVQRFLSKEAPALDAPPYWIVATSAGEVGIDLSADRLITDLDTADHLLQRVGRLNRFGTGEGNAYVIYSRKDLKEDSFQATLNYLQSCGGSVSPEVLRTHPPPKEALSKTPSLAPLVPWLIDAWSLTSIPGSDWSARPAVAPWLRGAEEKPAPETYVAWREDVHDLAHEEHGALKEEVQKILKVFPVRSYERLKQYTNDLRKELGESRYSSQNAILVAADSTIRVGELKDLLSDDSPVPYATLLLPPGVGHLDENGMVDWGKLPRENTGYDVSCPPNERLKIKSSGEDIPVLDGFRKRESVTLSNEADIPIATWTYYTKRKDREDSASVLLKDHQSQVAELAAQLARKLGLDEYERALHYAGQWHDQGKCRPIWQRAAGNADASKSIAKCPSNYVFKGRSLGGYRHELGSLRDAERELPADFSPEERDLALHFIAAHHGWARPHFETRAYDKESVRCSRKIALECAQRFGRLQQRYGPWKLAYLEAVFRSADAIASQDSPEQSLDA